MIITAQWLESWAQVTRPLIGSWSWTTSPKVHVLGIGFVCVRVYPCGKFGKLLPWIGSVVGFSSFYIILLWSDMLGLQPVSPKLNELTHEKQTKVVEDFLSPGLKSFRLVIFQAGLWWTVGYVWQAVIFFKPKSFYQIWQGKVLAAFFSEVGPGDCRKCLFLTTAKLLCRKLERGVFQKRALKRVMNIWIDVNCLITFPSSLATMVCSVI